MGDDDEAAFGGAEGVHAIGDGLEGVNVEAGVGFVEDAELRFEDGHLEDFIALLFAAGEAFVDAAAEQFFFESEELDLVLDELHEGEGVHFFLAAGLANGVDGAAEEVDVADAGDFDGILESEEDALVGAFIGLHFEQLFAEELDRAFGDFVIFAASEDAGKGAFSAAVGAHDCVHFAGADGQVDATEDFFLLDAGVQVLDLKHRTSYSLRDREERIPRTGPCPMTKK